MKLIMTAIALAIAAPAVAQDSAYPHGDHAPTKPKSGAPAKPAPVGEKKGCCDKANAKAKDCCDKGETVAKPAAAAHDHAH